MAHPQPTLLVMLLDIRVEWKQCNIKVVPYYGLPCDPRLLCSCSLGWLADSYSGTPREQHSGLRKLTPRGRPAPQVRLLASLLPRRQLNF